MGISERRVAGGSGAGWIQIEVGCHALPCSRRSVVQRVDALDPGRVVAAGVIALAHAEREAVLVVLAAPNESHIRFDFPGEKELMRRRENGDAAPSAFGDGDSVACD